MCERTDAVRQSVRRSESECDAGPDRRGLGWVALPLPCAHPNGPGDHALRAGGKSMKPVTIDLKDLAPEALTTLERAGFSRRRFLKGAGALIVGFSMAGSVRKLGAQ